MLPLVGHRLALKSIPSCRACTPNRAIFNVFGASSSGEPNQGQQYHERKILPYQQRQLYELVADVNSYHHFVPYCTGSRVFKESRKPGEETVKLEAELKVGFLGFEEKYISSVECRPYEMVQAVASVEIPLFKSLVTTWRFQPAASSSPHPTADPTSTFQRPTSIEGGPTMLSFDLKYEFANPLHAHVSAAFFGQMSKIMVRAFEERCLEVYGPGLK